uniref:ATPase family AAA domain-containing protein 2 n=1 Tax=Tetraodon nigroviridis TaxID=99883 RepID=H3CZF2_TETNG
FHRCLPLNLTAEDLASGALRDRVKVGASLADVDPMNLDSSVRFDSVGGLNSHIHALKEMVVFPLLYPEIFEKFRIQPPRGCLFYGPPGTGKTLVARALANECSHGDRKVSFFMRKGADCLSKWVGESERQLRLLFDQAYLMRPSIIFFDEIDGLAPVRSSRQDQIHSSIVSTLLALMDGLDSRGEIVVIGATNRLDSIDPALRRPGRFDREFLFNLPDKKARKHILKIHTRDWSPKLAEPFVEELAEKCVGYCGADIKALCTEAALVALRRRNPQIYSSSVKLKLDITSIVLGPGDFSKAMRTIVPASHRALAPPGQALSPTLRPLLATSFSLVLKALLRVFPHAQFSDRENMHCGDNQLFEEDLYSDDDNEEVSASIFEEGERLTFTDINESVLRQPTAYRPRLLLAGPPGSGQTSHLAPALLHHLDKLPVHRLDLPTLYSVSAKTPEESCAQVFRERRRSVPSVVFMPHVSEWWEAVSDTVKSTFLTLLQDVPSFSPVLIVATAESHYSDLPTLVRSMFQRTYGEVVSLCPPGEEDRRSFFSDLLLVQAARAPPRLRNPVFQILEILPVAEDSGPRVLSAEEQRRLAAQEENILRELRLFLRDVTKRLATDKRFNIFSKPVDIEEVSDYLEVIRQPMDLSTVVARIDTHQYLTAKDFLLDIDLICNNALEYNPDKDPGDKVIRHRACSLKDTAHAIFAAELDPEFDRMCEEIKEARKKRDMMPNEYCSSRDVQTPAQPTPALTIVAPKKPQTPGEEQIKTKTPRESGSFTCLKQKHRRQKNHIKRKIRRRPSWGRGIIRKKKIHKKGTEEEEGPEAEVEVTGPSDSCLTQDEESSCDTSGPQTNGHLASTEEESSNEPPDVAEARTSNADEQLKILASKEEESVPKECEDGDTSTQLQCLGDGSQIEVEGDNSKKQSGSEGSKRTPELVVIDHQRLSALLDLVVKKSEGYSVEQLERLYSLLSQCIYQHRKEYDKTQLLELLSGAGNNLSCSEC